MSCPIGRFGPKYVSNRLKADVVSEGYRLENLRMSASWVRRHYAIRGKVRDGVALKMR